MYSKYCCVISSSRYAISLDIFCSMMSCDSLFFFFSSCGWLRLCDTDGKDFKIPGCSIHFREKPFWKKEEFFHILDDTKGCMCYWRYTRCSNETKQIFISMTWRKKESLQYRERNKLFKFKSMLYCIFKFCSVFWWFLLVFVAFLKFISKAYSVLENSLVHCLVTHCFTQRAFQTTVLFLLVWQSAWK